MRKYIIINKNEVSSVDFSQVLETSENTLRYSLNKSKALLAFEGNTPSFLNGKTQYSYSEIRDILDTSEWSEEDE
tara:strand:+ start:7361 stop:7585 length:225 start_codon:yes stop_codon:yes gene_type:complete